MSATPNPKLSIDQLLFRNLYYRYKRFVTPSITIAICLLLFWFVVIPQIQNWFALKDSLNTDQQNLQLMHQNLSLITSLDDAKLDQTLTTATSALPTEKDFAGILSSLQNAAAIAGVSLGDYTFNLGDLSGLDQQGKAAQLPIQLNILLKGTVTNTEQFITQLKNQLPLSDTTAVSVNSNSSVTVTILFYYASLPKIVFKDQVALPVLAFSDQKILDSLSSGNPATIPFANPSPTISPSLSPSPTQGPTIVPTKVATSSAR